MEFEEVIRQFDVPRLHAARLFIHSTSQEAQNTNLVIFFLEAQAKSLVECSLCACCTTTQI